MSKSAVEKRSLIAKTLSSILPQDPGILYIHSSWSTINRSGLADVYDVLAWIEALLSKNWTIILPSFTFSFCKGKKFDVEKSPFETGILAKLVKESFPTAVRTSDPIYSHVVLGAFPRYLIETEPESAFGKGSIFEWLEANNANIMMLGCDWRFCTLFHRYEELAKVKYRYYKKFNGQANFGTKDTNVTRKLYVRDLVLGAENDFLPAVNQLKSNGEISSAPLWDSTVQVVNALALKNVCKTQLESDQLVYVSNRAIVEKRTRDNAERKVNTPSTLAVIGHENNELLEKEWVHWLEDSVPEREFKPITLPFGQAFQLLLDQNSILWTNSPNIRVFCDRLEAIPGTDLLSPKKTEAAVLEYANLIKKYHTTVGGWSILNRFSLATNFVDSMKLDLAGSVVARANAILSEVFNSIQQIAWVDVGVEAFNFPGSVFDSRLSIIGKFPYSEKFSKHLSKRWAGLVISILGKDTRLMVLDLDNTLWGGVLGEDGLSGLNVGSDYPGNAYKNLQKICLSFHKRGILLAIASKNDEDLVLEAFEGLPELVIEKQHLSIIKANWKPKWENIQDICSELNLGLQSVLFVDDNPVEREAVRRNLPDVKIIDLPKDPAYFASAIKECIFLNSVLTSDEDLTRARNVTSQLKRAHSLKNTQSMEDYYSSLEMIVHITPLNTGNSQRAAQLCQKTNQFNTTTRRYDQSELFDLVKLGHEVAVIGVEDKFSDFENIGLIVLKHNEANLVIDLYLMSCRVLGRGIETVAPLWACKRAKKLNYKSIKAEVIHTERNTPARNVYQDSGFEFIENETVWLKKIRKNSIPNWVKLIDNFD